jgi:hypothetical protein
MHGLKQTWRYEIYVHSHTSYLHEDRNHWYGTIGLLSQVSELCLFYIFLTALRVILSHALLPYSKRRAVYKYSIPFLLLREIIPLCMLSQQYDGFSWASQ